MTENDIIDFVSGLPGTVTVTAGEDNGAPEAAWGDTFFFHDPDGDTPPDRRMPFATIVTSDYDGFDTASRLYRPDVLRLNIAVGRAGFQQVIGYPPAEHAEHHAAIDYAVLDQILPHPVYAAQSWIAILNPGERTGDRARALLRDAHSLAARRHRPRRGVS